MTRSASPGSAATTWVWAVVAGVVVALFLGWLALTSEPSVVATVQEGDTTTAAAELTGVPVTAEQLEAGFAQYAGQEIQLGDVPVTSKMGTQVLWVELPSRSPFLVKADPATVAAINPQTRVTVVGRLVPKTDSVLNAWQQAGVLENAGHRAQAEYGTHYIEARAVRQAGGS